MSKKMKMSLEELRVTSFVTHLAPREAAGVNGGQEVATVSPCKTVDVCLSDGGDGGEGDPDELGGGFRGTG